MSKLFDNHSRPITYLRLAVTDRCNLRCFYCMPEEGINYLPRTELLSFEEMIRLVTILASMGISKIRFTGGEPFMRNDLMSLIKSITRIPGIDEWHITTNGILAKPYISEMVGAGVRSVNLSLDTLDAERFVRITRRNDFGKCLETLDALVSQNVPVKINAVVMDGKNTEDIVPLAALTANKNISVRFIEEMPFNGSGSVHPTWSYKKILAHLKDAFPDIYKIADPPHATALQYAVPGHQGTIGIIPAFSRTFCGTCNRIRLTAQGILKTCLYDDGVLNIKKLMRDGMSDDDLQLTLLTAFHNRPKNGFEAEERRAGKTPVHESMSTIGG